MKVAVSQTSWGLETFKTQDDLVRVARDRNLNEITLWANEGRGRIYFEICGRVPTEKDYPHYLRMQNYSSEWVLEEPNHWPLEIWVEAMREIARLQPERVTKDWKRRLRRSLWRAWLDCLKRGNPAPISLLWAL